MTDAQPHRPDVACPNMEELAAFSAGRLGWNRLEQVAEHLEKCAHCRELLERVEEVGDRLLDALRQVGIEDPLLSEPELQRLESEARALVSPAREDVPRLRPDGFPQLPGYDQVRRLGSLAWGSVFRARQVASGRLVVLRVLPIGAAARSEQRRRFLADSARASTPADSRFLPVLDLLPIGERWLVVTPFIDGADLGRIVRERRSLQQGKWVQGVHPLTASKTKDYVRDMVRVLTQIIQAVAQLHQLRFPYPELKPSNCLLDRKSQVWLADYGIGGLTGRGISALDEEWGGALIGTSRAEPADFHVGNPGYISPEEWAGRRDPDTRIDVFRLGVLAYHALTLELPFNIAPISARRRLPAPPSTRQAATTSALDAVILKALAPSPDERYPSAVELLADWRQASGDFDRFAFWTRLLRWLGFRRQSRAQPPSSAKDR